MIEISTIKTDCRFFDGSRPCVWNKTEGCECASCERYLPRGARVLIVKLDAIGDVLRSTCIVPKIKEKFPESYLTWITRSESMEFIASNPDIDETWEYDATETLSRLHVETWDVVYNLDNTRASSALASIADAREKIGFVLTDSGISPTNDAARQWLEMAAFDRVKSENTRSYQEIMYEICGFAPPVSRPYLHVPEADIERARSLIADRFPDRAENNPIVGVNTGSGVRWPKKMFSVDQIVEVVDTLLARNPDCSILLLGGPDEVNKNTKIAADISSTRVAHIGCDHSLLQFCAIIKKCRLLFCGDTLALHIAAGLEVPTIAVFGPTSFAEIYDYDGLIEKLRTNQLDCLCCYGNCDKKENCMTMFSSNFLVEKINKRLLSR